MRTNSDQFGDGVGEFENQGLGAGNEPGTATLSVASIGAVGESLIASLEGVLGEVKLTGARSATRGPVAFARELGLDKVLLSRVLKALRMREGTSSLRAMPGPDPLRRLVSRAAAQGATKSTVDAAMGAIDRYERLLRDTVRGRGMLDTILSVWDPGSRRDFEQRRKQGAFTAISQIRGAQARMNHSTVLVLPSKDAGLLDIVWITGYLGLYRSRPGARVKFASRRLTPGKTARHPESIDGRSLESPEALLLPAFCSKPMPKFDATSLGECVFYTLGGEAFGADSAVDVVYAEVNRAELPRVPQNSTRKRFFFAEPAVPSKVLQYDVLVHADLGWGPPELMIYDTAYEGAASPNDPSRDLDKLDLAETVEQLPRSVGGGLSLRSPDVPGYADMIQSIAASVGADLDQFVAHRTRIEYPLYGAQVTMAFLGANA